MSHKCLMISIRFVLILGTSYDIFVNRKKTNAIFQLDIFLLFWYSEKKLLQQLHTFFHSLVQKVLFIFTNNDKIQPQTFRATESWACLLMDDCIKQILQTFRCITATWHHKDRLLSVFMRHKFHLYSFVMTPC